VLARRIRPLLVSVAVCAAPLPGAALASTSFAALHECQKPVRTGVEVYGLRNVPAAHACALALALFAWETKGKRETVLYGCRYPVPESGGYPYLRLHRFHGWRLSLRGNEQLFTMSRGRSSFHVTGTDFPLNCT
jgi:hypothetical protein